MTGARLTHSELAFRSAIESRTNGHVILTPPVLTRAGIWKATVHGGTVKLRGCSGDTREQALRRLWQSVDAEPGVPTR